MTMRQQFVQTVEDILKRDKKTVLLLGDIGVYGFRNAFLKYPDRVYNIGILEQATIGLAAGLAKDGLIPIVHTIAPFLVERALEQLKDDFCYQRHGGNFVSVGASYDYASLGCTHHCPGDVGALMGLPGMEIVVPGTAEEFDLLFRQSYNNGHPTYFRLSERENPVKNRVSFGKAIPVKIGRKATIVAVGTTLRAVLEATQDLDVGILYYTTIAPFDIKTLKKYCYSPKIFLCEPYYEGGVVAEIVKTLNPRSLELCYLGVPREFLTSYGQPEEHDDHIGLTPRNIRRQVLKLIQNK